ncbi:MAG: DUF4127 family protein [Phascolarctobacterium sp.]|nr:DUF4127 family protein [Phascolarctobacterium sp.]
MYEIKKYTAILFTACCLLALPAQAKKLTIIYVPLDNRPVCDAYVQQTMAAVGCNIIMPPEKYIAGHDNSGDAEAICSWLQHKAPKADAAVISSDSLIYGGLVASRTHQIPVETLNKRLKNLHDLETSLPIKLYVFSTIMRTPYTSSGNVEPEYYSKLGPAIFTYSQLLDKGEQNKLSLLERLKKQALERNLPRRELKDWLDRRKKNLNVNHELTIMARGNRFHYLAIGKDDNAALSATHMEARSISRNTFDIPDKKFQILPGVDQLGLLLLTRAYNEANGVTPAVYPLYSRGAGPSTLPQYSDTRLQDSVPQQITAAGAKKATNISSADLVLALNTPENGIMQDTTAGSNQFFASPANKDFILNLTKQLNAGLKVSLADVSYSNGADNGFMDALARSGQVERLTAYNGWNTADNTIGFAIAQGILSVAMSPQQSNKLMRQRIIDDWYYQSNARNRMIEFFRQKGRENLRYNLGKANEEVLKQVTSDCQNLARKYSITHDTAFKLSFPWNRLFEIDVEIKK